MWPLPFWVGLAVLAIVWLGPLPERAQTAFSPNMIIHLAVVAVAAPLLAWGLAGLDGAPVTRHAVRWILLAALFDMAVVLGWHVPLLHEAAARSWVLFSVEQITFLIAGLGMWYLAFRDLSSVDAIVVAAAFFLTFMHMSVLGIVLVLAPHLLYDPSVCRGSFGLSSLEDQRLGGILMASWGSFTYLAGAMWLLWRTLGRRADAARDGRSGQTL
ncbi:MAG: cytochrome c oxidase assembly protein [Hyphomicrobium sp.]